MMGATTTAERAGVHTVHVNLGPRSYDIRIGRGLVEDIAPIAALAKGGRAAIVTDDHVEPLYAGRIEATLALGATVRQAMLPTLRRSLRSGMIPLIDSTKTTGVIFFPGTMVGMLLAGADPVDAVRLQLILLWTLLGSVSLSALTARKEVASGKCFFLTSSAARMRCSKNASSTVTRSGASIRTWIFDFEL